MRKLLLLLIIALAACADKAPSAEELATQAAKGYYEALLAGRYDAFVDGRADIESLPADYRKQLVIAVKQTMAQQRQAHGDLTAIDVSSQSPARMDSSLQIMQVFLVLAFADSTREEIVVPMIEREGQWLISSPSASLKQR